MNIICWLISYFIIYGLFYKILKNNGGEKIRTKSLYIKLLIVLLSLALYVLGAEIADKFISSSLINSSIRGGLLGLLVSVIPFYTPNTKRKFN